MYKKYFTENVIEVYQLSKWKDNTATWTNIKKINSFELKSPKFKETEDYLWTTIKPKNSDINSNGKIKNWKDYR